WILRVPFRNLYGEMIPHHVSRFQIWPYLEVFADEAKNAVLAEFPGVPDLVVGHYSDGNLVAHLLCEDFGTTHCAAVHALEKTKYLFSDLRWADMEHDYHFSLQFTADLIAYNSADFIITSSFREIGGTNTEMGMFESYETYSMPGLYRVQSGLDPRLARFNIVPPGVNEEHFYPAHEKDRRVEAVRQHLVETTFGENPSEGSVGRLDKPDRPAIFAMSRIDKVKNLAGLVELYGKSKRLRKKANLVIISSETDASRSNDIEEIEQINRIYELRDQHQLDGVFRWRGARLDKVETGEIYRVVADMKGIFVQPALMETFGLTVIEAMACGCPVVVTCFGGPAEIVEPGLSGEIENPNDHEAFADAIYRVISDKSVWEDRVRNGIERVRTAYAWSQHANKILSLTNLYSYWEYLNVMNRSSLDRYIHTLFHTVYRPRAEEMMRGA
ncbi:MAG: glycosyltransferase, partial [Candidatus Omnitrophica bacterium]|nr:glycosyltransferase [Candidatus Omnitrophota bacterium]